MDASKPFQCARCGGRFFLHPEREATEGCPWCEWGDAVVHIATLTTERDDARASLNAAAKTLVGHQAVVDRVGVLERWQNMATLYGDALERADDVAWMEVENAVDALRTPPATVTKEEDTK